MKQNTPYPLYFTVNFSLPIIPSESINKYQLIVMTPSPHHSNMHIFLELGYVKRIEGFLSIIAFTSDLFVLFQILNIMY